MMDDTILVWNADQTKRLEDILTSDHPFPPNDRKDHSIPSSSLPVTKTSRI